MQVMHKYTHNDISYDNLMLFGTLGSLVILLKPQEGVKGTLHVNS